MPQYPERNRLAFDCCYRQPERRQIIPDRVYLWNHTSSCLGDMHKVSRFHYPPSTLNQLSYRCPTECKLTRSDSPWSCAVKLHFHTNIRGEAIPARIESFGDAISDKAEVEERIRRAQRAILNPGTNPSIFLGGATVEENETSFSRNYISLEISSQELEDLSFVDLPGLIASVGEHGRVDDIELVKNLVISYIERESCVILLTVACESPFQTC